MNFPDQYLKYNKLQRNAASHILSNYLSKLTFSDNDSECILDIGCGPGDVTIEILASKLPKNFKQLLGTDVSKNMIEHAKQLYQNDIINIQFEQLDITTKYLPKEMQENFHHIFSFHCLHWVDQKIAFENIFKLLRPKGEALLMFISDNFLLNMYRIISQETKWVSHFDPNIKLPLLYDFKDEEAVKFELETIGFHVEDINTLIMPTHVEFDGIDDLSNIHRIVNPYISHLSHDLQVEYTSNYIKECENFGYISQNGSGVSLVHPLIVMHLKKPS